MDKREKTESHNKKLGRRGELAAARYLESRGYDILERNWICPAGEADIIAQDGCDLVFVEVKTRSDLSRGFPSEAVTGKKRSRYERIAAWYLHQGGFDGTPVRFDVVGILMLDSDRAFLRHYRNAFGAPSWE